MLLSFQKLNWLEFSDLGRVGRSDLETKAPCSANFEVVREVLHLGRTKAFYSASPLLPIHPRELWD